MMINFMIIISEQLKTFINDEEKKFKELIKLIKKRIEEYIQNSIHVLNTDLQYVEPDKK